MDQIFVFVHRWFRRGEGWAYHPEMEGRVRDIAAVVAPRLLRGERGRFDIPLDHGLLLGEIVADTDCENATATARGASIAKVALLPAEPVFRKNADRLYRALQAVQPPSVEGPDGKLVIKYRGVPTPVVSGPQIEAAEVTEPTDTTTEAVADLATVTMDRPSGAEPDQADAGAAEDRPRSSPATTALDDRLGRLFAAVGIASTTQLVVLYAAYYYGDLLLFLCGIVTLGSLGGICWWLRYCQLAKLCCSSVVMPRTRFLQCTDTDAPAQKTQGDVPHQHSRLWRDVLCRVMIPRFSRRPRMQILVEDRRTVEAGVALGVPYIVISIHDPGERPAEIPPDPNCQATLCLSFHDADLPQREASAACDGCLTAADAERIWRFVQEHLPGIRAIVCHCEQGMSRSPAVAQALAETLGVGQRHIVLGRNPNKRVYRLLKDTFARLRKTDA